MENGDGGTYEIDVWGVGAIEAIGIKETIWDWIDRGAGGELLAGCPQDLNKLGRCEAILDGLVGKRDEITPVIWRGEIWEAARAGHDSFGGLPVTREYLVKRPPQLWLWDDIRIIGKDNGLCLPDRCATIGQILVLSRGVNFEGDRLIGYSGRMGLTLGVVFVEWDESHGHLVLDFSKAPILRFMPTLYEGTTVPNVTLFTELWALLHFMESEFVEVADEGLPRPMRRRYQKSGRAVPQVKTILLRHRQRNSREGSSDGSREWHCQWFVGGHWRKQWKGPRAEPHIEPTYIRPYLKGPTDKPLKPPARTVVKVVR